MKTMKGTPAVSELRQRAEEELGIAAGSAELSSEMSPEKMKELIHELQVHQIELKMQNHELRRIQEELEKTRDRYSHLYDFSPVGYVTFTEKGIIDEANLHLASMLGVERSTLVGKPFSRFVLRDDQDTFYKLRRRLLETDESRASELRLVKKDGHAFFANLQCMVVRSGGDGSRSIRGAVSDITERRRIADALQEARNGLELQVAERTKELSYEKELLRTILDHIPVMICLFDPDGEVKVVNSHYADIVGWEAEKGENTGPAEAPKPDPAILEASRPHMPHGEQGWEDFILRTKHGGKLETSWANIRLSDGSLIAIGIDISERKRADEKNRLYLKRLERSNKELQDFVFAASHDLQEPLRKIHSFGDLLIMEFNDFISEEGRDYLARMQDAAARMRNLINSLLAYSRVTTHRRPILQVDLGEAASEALSNLSVLIKETKGSVQVGELPTVGGDRVQMIQLFQNLMGNALKFHKKGKSPRVQVYAREIREEGSDKADAYEICVEDDGIGFDEAYLSRIFSPFKKLHGRGEYEGAGIGLAICMKIAERHHGRITATSSPGEGAIFMVTLPRKIRDKMFEEAGPG